MARLWNGPSLGGDKRRNGATVENKMAVSRVYIKGKSDAKQMQNIKSRLAYGVHMGNSTS